MKTISQPRKAPIREVQRANILLRYSENIISKETMKYLSSRSGQFLYVHTPKDGSLLNLVEMLFGKMARTFLKHILVNSKQELKERILPVIKEINDDSLVYCPQNGPLKQLKPAMMITALLRLKAVSVILA